MQSSVVRHLVAGFSHPIEKVDRHSYVGFAMEVHDDFNEAPPIRTRSTIFMNEKNELLE